MRYQALILLIAVGATLAADGCRSRRKVETKPSRAFIAMSDPSAAAYIVSDVSPSVENGAWRWTGQKPALRLHLSEIQNWKLVVDYSIAEATLKETGPVTLTFFVNGRPLGTETWKDHGKRRFDRPVPADWLLAGDNSVIVEIDKVYVSPTDGNRLGFILTSAGFTH